MTLHFRNLITTQGEHVNKLQQLRQLWKHRSWRLTKLFISEAIYRISWCSAQNESIHLTLTTFNTA